MERDPLDECAAIPIDRVIVVREGNQQWYMDILLLLKNMVLRNNYSNPMTGNPLSQDAIDELNQYRQQQTKNIGVQYKKQIKYITLDGFSLIGDLHIACVRRISNNSSDIVKYHVYHRGVPIHEGDLELPISTLSNRNDIYVAVERGNITGEDYDQLKEFVLNHNKYKYEFDPFPREPVTRREKEPWVYGTGKGSERLAPAFYEGHIPPEELKWKSFGRGRFARYGVVPIDTPVNPSDDSFDNEFVHYVTRYNNALRRGDIESARSHALQFRRPLVGRARDIVEADNLLPEF